MGTTVGGDMQRELEFAMSFTLRVLLLEGSKGVYLSSDISNNDNNNNSLPTQHCLPMASMSFASLTSATTTTTTTTTTTAAAAASYPALI